MASLLPSNTSPTPIHLKSLDEANRSETDSSSFAAGAPPPGASSSSATAIFSKLSPEEVASRLGTSLQHGLSPSDAEARSIKHGLNELPHDEPEPVWLRFLTQFKEPLILLLLASALLSFILHNFDDAISITLAVTIVVSVGFVQEYRSEKSLEALNKLVPHYAHLVRNVVLDMDSFAVKSEAPRDAANPNSSATHGATTVLATRLVPGDLVLFTTGDRIPADIRITKCVDLTIDESNLTGENEPVMKYSEALEQRASKVTGDSLNGNDAFSSVNRPGTESPFFASPAAGTVGTDVRLNEQHNVAFMGTLVRSGYGQGIVISIGSRTEFGSISASLQEIESPRTPLQLSMDRLGQELSYMSFIVIGLIIVIGLLQGRKLLDMFTIGVSLAVAAIPEGLPIIVTVTLALGVLRMAKHGAIVRRLPSVETLGSVNTVCTDKTGTLTLNHMTVTKMWYFDASEPFDVRSSRSDSLVMNAATNKILRVGNIANNARLSRLHADSPATAASAAILSSTMDNSSGAAKSRWVGQPTDVAILDLLDIYGEDDFRDIAGERVAETPFSSERKWMGVVIGNPHTDAQSSSHDDSNTAFVKGSIEEVLKRCDTYLSGTGREVILDGERRAAANQAAESMASEGLRVLAFATGTTRKTSQVSETSSERKLDDSLYTGLVFCGLVGMNDPPRKGVDKSIRRLMGGGVKVIVITGDAETTATAIAIKLGMPISPLHNSRAVLRGDEIDHMTVQELSQAVIGTSIFARTSPEHKLKIVRALQFRGDIVAMTGDGVNDAPALKKADIGISMGKLGTDVAKEAADMILTDDDFSTILRAIEQGKGIFYNIQNFITFQLSTSVAALTLVFLSTAFGYKNPLNAMQILWISMCHPNLKRFVCTTHANTSQIFSWMARQHNHLVSSPSIPS